jgi:hypothetical protein
MSQTQAECTGMVNDEIVVQVLDALKENIVQAQTQVTELTKKFQVIAERSMKHTKFRWLGMSHMSLLGAYWMQAELGRRVIFGREACKRKETVGRKSNTRACMEDLTMLGLGFL